MQEFLARIVGEQWAFPVLVALGLILALIILYVILRLFRGRGDGGTFVVGGRNRKPRLAVMDATAIDNYRRLVLVRRDDVEHLILIGGSADVVVERDIRAAGQVRRPQPPGETVAEQLGPAAPELAYAPQPRPIPARPPRPQTPVTEPHRAPQRPAPPPTVRPAPAQVRPAAPPAAAVRQPQLRPAAPPAPSDEDFDDDLLRELEVELDADVPAAKPQPVSLDDEMAKLLGELSNNNKR